MSTAATPPPPRNDNNGSALHDAHPANARDPHDREAPDVIRVLRDDGSLDPKHDPKLSHEDVVTLYRAMVKIRLLDDRLVTLQRQGRIGFHIGSLGEEATSAGIRTVMFDIEDGLRRGDQLSDCVDRHPKVFPEFYRGILRSAELTGQLDPVPHLLEPRAHHRLRAIGHAEFHQEMFDVAFGCVEADHQTVSDLLVGSALCYQ